MYQAPTEEAVRLARVDRTRPGMPLVYAFCPISTRRLL